MALLRPFMDLQDERASETKLTVLFQNDETADFVVCFLCVRHEIGLGLICDGVVDVRV